MIFKERKTWGAMRPSS